MMLPSTRFKGSQPNFVLGGKVQVPIPLVEQLTSSVDGFKAVALGKVPSCSNKWQFLHHVRHDNYTAWLW